MRLAVALTFFVLILSACGTLERSARENRTNPAPCPNIFVLSEAARFIEFEGEDENLNSVAYSGEILDVRTSCRYYDDVPIEAQVSIDFAVGRGPMGESDSIDVEYFVAVTRTNRDVIEKEVIRVPVKFRRGQTVVTVNQEIKNIIIPRLGKETSGLNFEIAVGFVLDRDQVIFNRSGKSLKFPDA